MTKPVTAILVGGPADGRRAVLHPRQTYLNIVQRAAVDCTNHPDVMQTVAVDVSTVQYRVFFGGGDVVVMCPQHMRDSEAMQRLLHGYSQEVWK